MLGGCVGAPSAQANLRTGRDHMLCTAVCTDVLLFCRSVVMDVIVHMTAFYLGGGKSISGVPCLLCLHTLLVY